MNAAGALLFSSNRCSINIEADSFTFKVRWFQTLLVSARQASWSQCKVSNLESWINPPGCPVKNRTRDEADCLRPGNTGTPSIKAPWKRRHRTHHSDLQSEVYRTEGYPTGVLGWDGWERNFNSVGYLQYPGHTSHFVLEPKYHLARTFI